MPIDIEEFEMADDDFFRGRGEFQTEEVLEFLAYNPRKAYARSEIQSALELSTMETLATLSRLEHKGLVRHKGEFWALTEEIDSPEDIPETAL